MNSIRTIFLNMVDWKAKRKALKVGNVWYTYEDLSRRVESTASKLTEKGVEEGDVVGQIAENSLEMIVNTFAVFRIGAIYSPLSTSFSLSEIYYRVEHSGMKAVLADQNNLRRLKEMSNDSKNSFIVLPVSFEGKSEQFVPIPYITNDQPALLLYTSGSTGLPKGCLLSEKNLLVNATQVINRTLLTERDRILHQMPLHHTNGINNNLIAPFLIGAQVVLGSNFFAPNLFNTIQSERPTLFTGVPTMFYRLLKETVPDNALESLRFVRCGSAPLSSHLERKIEEHLGIPIITSYGLTEGTCTSTMTPISHKKFGSVGTPLDDQEVKIVDLKTGEFLPPGKEGEVVIRGDNIMLGYYKNESETNKSIYNEWLHTGDLGKLDEDDYLFLSSRLKDLIVRGGENVSPKEVEEMLSLHNNIEEVAVIGVQDEEYGEIPVAIFVSDKIISAEELKEYSKRQLSRFKVPERFIQTDALPRNHLGKIERSKLKSLADMQMN